MFRKVFRKPHSVLARDWAFQVCQFDTQSWYHHLLPVNLLCGVPNGCFWSITTFPVFWMAIPTCLKHVAGNSWVYKVKHNIYCLCTFSIDFMLKKWANHHILFVHILQVFFESGLYIIWFDLILWIIIWVKLYKLVSHFCCCQWLAHINHPLA